MKKEIKNVEVEIPKESFGRKGRKEGRKDG